MNLFVFLGVLLMFSVLAYSNDGYVENMRAPRKELRKEIDLQMRKAKQGIHDSDKSRTRRKMTNKIKCALLKNDVRDIAGVTNLCQETYNDIPIEGMEYGKYKIGSSTMYSGHRLNKSMENVLKDLLIRQKKKKYDTGAALEEFKTMRKNQHYKPIEGSGSCSVVFYVPDETDNFKKIRIAYKITQLFIDPEGNVNQPVIYQDVNSETGEYFGEYDTVHNYRRLDARRLTVTNRKEDDQPYKYCFWRNGCSKAPLPEKGTKGKDFFFIDDYLLNATTRGDMCFYETNIFRVIDGIGFNQEQISKGLADGSLDVAYSVPLDNKTAPGNCDVYCRATDPAVSDAYYFTFETLKLLGDIYPGEPVESVLGGVAMKLPIRIVVNVDNKVGPKTYSIRRNHFDNIAVILLPSETDDKLAASSVVDIVAHELTHAILKIQGYEPRRGMGKALGESLADIVAANMLNHVYYESDFFGFDSSATTLEHWSWKFGGMWQKNSTALRCVNDSTCTGYREAITTTMDLGRNMEDVMKTAQTRDEHDMGAFFSMVILNMHMAQNDLDRKFLLYTYFMVSKQWTSDTDFFGAAEALLKLVRTNKAGMIMNPLGFLPWKDIEFVYSLDSMISVFEEFGIRCNRAEFADVYGTGFCSANRCFVCAPV